MDATRMLENDHRAVDGMLKEFEQTTSTETRQELAERIIRELSIHSVVEEQVVYPFVREHVPDLREHVLQDLEEHHFVKEGLAELDRMSVDDERFVPKMHVIGEQVRHHVKEEEEELFPRVRQELGTEVLDEMGKAVEEAKRMAPTKPHPHAPDEPPGNVLAGSVAALMDRARDFVRQKVRS